MALNVVTTEDLQLFKHDLLTEFKKLLTEKPDHAARKWLKSSEVRKMLSVSPGTLQNLRVNGTLPYTKIAGTMYYAYDDIMKMLEKHKRN